jgi:predicted RNA methylase
MRRTARINQIVADLSKKPISESRILDLACWEGDFAAEFAMRGANVVATEGSVALIALKGSKKEKVLARPFDESILNERVDAVPCVPAVQKAIATSGKFRRFAGRLYRSIFPKSSGK